LTIDTTDYKYATMLYIGLVFCFSFINLNPRQHPAGLMIMHQIGNLMFVSYCFRDK